MKRLIASNYRPLLTKPSIPLKSFTDKYGNFYEFNVRLVNVKQLFYSITRHLPYETISLYDGTDFDEAFDFFAELMLALKGVKDSEGFNASKQTVLEYTKDLLPQRQSVQLQYGNYSLGDSEIVWS